MNKMIPKSALSQYAIGEIQEINVVSSGLSHQTFSVATPQGKYIIQRLHEVLSSQEIADDFLAITKFLNAQGFESAECVLTNSGTVLAKDEEGFVWRMQTQLEGEVYDKIDDLEKLKEVGRLFGEFHRVIAKLDTPLRTSFVLPQKTNVIYEKFLSVLPDLYTEVQTEVEFLKSEFPNYFLPEGLPQHVIHGDPKVSNFLFREGRAVAVIDLDTCNRQSLLPDLGDAFRSWCGNEEDDPDNVFSFEKFQAGWRGYKEGTGDLLTQQEIELVPRAVGAIILLLACRFLTDYFEDSYFGWDESRYDSRKEHNLARCRGQLAEFRSFLKVKDQMQKSL